MVGAGGLSRSVTMKSEVLSEKNIMMRSTDVLFKEVYEKLAQENDKDSVLCRGVMDI
jgi:hypothetical protein